LRRFLHLRPADQCRPAALRAERRAATARALGPERTKPRVHAAAVGSCWLATHAGARSTRQRRRRDPDAAGRRPPPPGGGPRPAPPEAVRPPPADDARRSPRAA